MKFSTVLLATCLIAFTAAQWPCHDYGWNGAVSNCASCNVGSPSGANVWTGASTYSVCTNCTAGFFLNQSACIPCTANCTQCASNGACQSGGCAYGFAFVPTNSTCVACPSSLNCAKCDYSSGSNTYGNLARGPFVCTACQHNGFYISSSGACTACPAGCTNGASSNAWSAPGACPSGMCSSCASAGYVNTGSGSTVTCTACASTCSTCSAASTCTACASPSNLASGTCTACTVANCGACQITGASTCDSCSTGYYLSSNTCTACPTGCSACTSATACTACSTGYYLPVGTTVTCTAAAAANSANCTTLASNTGLSATTATYGYCTACAANTTLSTTGTCVPCPSNCTVCALTSSTATTSVCLMCQLGFGLNDTTGNCVPCPPNCDYCDGSGVCTKCRQGTWGSFFPIVTGYSSGNLLNSYVPSTLQVTQGYYLPPNQCQQCPYNCSSCANSTFCYNNCTKNYVFNSTTNQCLPNGASRIVIAGFAFLGALFYFI